MANDKVEYLTYNKQNSPEVLEVANELAGLEQRKTHDSIRLLILEEGRAKIARLKSQATQLNGESQGKSEKPAEG